MRYLLDTNIVSETYRQKPNPEVIQWLKNVPSEKLYISVLTIGEIRKSIEKLNDPQRKIKLITWLDVVLLDWFDKRVLPIDLDVAEQWGRLAAHYTLPAIDGLLASTAFVHNLTFVTRNVKDFKINELHIINPFVLNS
ncbi:MAG: type II toxin-antitoxin system VapC family toxin [Proteobacteria bacterium]|nr:type II toxin-antitoxin system VapC family toxin [Pseudomonadota bacterium]